MGQRVGPAAGTEVGWLPWEQCVPGPGEQELPHLDPLGLLMHRLHVVVELCDIREPSEVLVLLGQEFLREPVQVPVLGQLQQAEVGHLVALETLPLLLLLHMLLGLES